MGHPINLTLHPLDGQAAQCDHPHGQRTIFVLFSKSSGAHYRISFYVSFARLSPKQWCRIGRLYEEQEPSLYNQAIKDPCWQQATADEIQALMENTTWDFIPLPPHRRPIGCTWVYKIKYKTDESIK